ncbi:MAG: Fic family protein [Nitrospirota bacterium]|nr:Fic family protein [Nitrospirota bacterium]
MTWNWQEPKWPDFSYDATSLAEYEKQLLHRSGVLSGALKYFDENEKTQFTVSLISDEALKTSEIEGEFLSRDSLQSSIRRHFGLATPKRKVSKGEQGIADMMVDLYRNYQAPLSHEQLFTWHDMLTSGRRDLTVRGGYRTHKEPMQVVSGPVHSPRVHFEAPPSKKIKKEMNGFIKWFNVTAPKANQALPPLTRAGIAHLYFVCIHPFEDGNGRIGRAIAEKALSQCLGQPTLIALSQTINSARKAYYQTLEENNKDLGISDWLVYFAQTILDAQEYTQRSVDFLIEKAKLYDRLRGKLNERQEKILARMFREGLEGFKGGLSAENYIKIVDTSRATATRDLQDLVEKGALMKTGERKYTRYLLPMVGRN